MPSEERIVISHSEDPARALRIGTLGELFKLRYEIVDRVDATVRRSEQVSPHGLGAEAKEVDVPVHEPWRECPPA